MIAHNCLSCSYFNVFHVFCCRHRRVIGDSTGHPRSAYRRNRCRDWMRGWPKDTGRVYSHAQAYYVFTQIFKWLEREDRRSFYMRHLRHHIFPGVQRDVLQKIMAELVFLHLVAYKETVHPVWKWIDRRYWIPKRVKRHYYRMVKYVVEEQLAVSH